MRLVQTSRQQQLSLSQGQEDNVVLMVRRCLCVWGKKKTLHTIISTQDWHELIRVTTHSLAVISLAIDLAFLNRWWRRIRTSFDCVQPTGWYTIEKTIERQGRGTHVIIGCRCSTTLNKTKATWCSGTGYNELNRTIFRDRERVAFKERQQGNTITNALNEVAHSHRRVNESTWIPRMLAHFHQVGGDTHKHRQLVIDNIGLIITTTVSFPNGRKATWLDWGGNDATPAQSFDVTLRLVPCPFLHPFAFIQVQVQHICLLYDHTFSNLQINARKSGNKPNKWSTRQRKRERGQGTHHTNPLRPEREAHPNTEGQDKTRHCNQKGRHTGNEVNKRNKHLC